MTERVRLMMSALGLAMEAKCGTLDKTVMEDCLSRAEQLLPTDDPLYTAIVTFKVQAEQPLDKDAICELGDTLADRIDVLTRPALPDPVDIARRDIHG